MLKPYGTIVLSEDKTYPGLVTAIVERTVRVIWYKWGYDCPDTISDWMTHAAAEKHAITAAECIRRFRDVPPQYNPGA